MIFLFREFAPVRGSCAQGVRSIAELRARVGAGEALVNPTVVRTLAVHEDLQQRMPRATLEGLRDQFLAHAQTILPGVQGAAVGSYRRRAETSGDMVWSYALASVSVLCPPELALS